MTSIHTRRRFLSAALAAAMLAFGSLAARAQEQLSRPLIDHYVTLQTTKGPIVIRVFFSMVPYTASNFLNLVANKFYDGLTFHRVESWCIQGGDPAGNGTGNFMDPATGRPRFIKLETNERLTHNAPGVVAMARSSDPNSASCQFYILKSSMPQLNGQYAVFGQVVRGMQAVYAMGVGDRIVSARITDPQRVRAADAGLANPQDGASTTGPNAPPAQGQGSGQAPATKPSANDSGF